MTETASARERRWPGPVCLAAVALTVVAYGAALLLAPLNQDEGWYLYAARLFGEGLLPHRDFFYTQGLALPAVYGTLWPLWAHLGVLGGRLLSALFALTGLFLAGEGVARLFPEGSERRLARLLLWALLGCGLYYVTFTAVPKAYALCTLIEAGAFAALGGITGRERLPLRAAFAGLMLGLLPGVRLSMGILLPVAGLWLLIRRRTLGDAPWLAFGMTALVGLAVALGPELFMLPGFLEAQRFHLMREPAAGPLLSILGSLSRLVRGMPLLAAATLGFCCFLPEAARALGRERFASVLLWGFSSVILTAVHLAAPVPYDDYLVPSLLPAAMAVATGLAALPSGDTFRRRFALLALLAAAVVGMGGAAVAEGWIVIRQDRFWLTVKEEPDILRLRRAAETVRSVTVEKGLPRVLWTQDIYLAVEAGMRVPRGLEMGPFGLTAAADAPDAPWAPLRTDRLAETYAEAGVAARSGYTFLLNAPRMTDLRQGGTRDALLDGLRRAFPEDVAVFPDFGQQHTTLTVAVKP